MGFFREATRLEPIRKVVESWESVVIYRAPESQDVAIAVRVEGFGIEAAAAPRQGLAMLGVGAIGDDLVEARVWPMSALSPQHGRLPFDNGPVRALALPPLRARSRHSAPTRCGVQSHDRHDPGAESPLNLVLPQSYEDRWDLKARIRSVSNVSAENPSALEMPGPAIAWPRPGAA
jgi:hypothetical protein